MSSLKLVTIVLAAVLVGTGIHLAQTTAAPGPPLTSPPKLSDASRVQLLNAYMRAMMYSNDVQRRQQELCDGDTECKQARENTQKSIDAYNALVPEVILKDKLPAGTGFNVNAANGTVNMVLPPPTVPPAPVPAPVPTPKPEPAKK